MKNIGPFFPKIPKYCFSNKASLLEIFSPDYFLDNYKKSLEKTGLFSFNLGYFPQSQFFSNFLHFSR